ncbi:MAG TPA: STAS domain-containing protein [Solirubrobacteraceae bacterium]|nr:STAS domain-containing protein [Solirubrobacteraceae bacterium]
MQRDFDIESVWRGDALYLEVEGELDLATAPTLDEALIRAEASTAALVVIDLTGASFIDSTGLRTLLEAHLRSEADGNRLRITGASDQAQRLFRLAGLLDRLPLLLPTDAAGASGPD